MKRYGLLAGTYIGLVILANWLASRYVVSVGFGRKAPAGVFCIGGVLVLRDWLQQLRGLLWTMPLVYSAGLASWAITLVRPLQRRDRFLRRSIQSGWSSREVAGRAGTVPTLPARSYFGFAGPLQLSPWFAPA